MPAITTGGPHPATPVGPGPGAVPRAIGPGQPADRSPGPADQRAPRRRSPFGRWASPTPGTGTGVRAGQLVAAQVAAALVLTALGRPAPVTAAAALVAVLLVAVAVLRVRGRWLFEWLGIAAGHLTRRRELTAPAGAADLLDLVAPGTVVHSTELTGGPAAVLEDTEGMVVLLELGDPGDLLGDASRAIPAPSALLPQTGPDAPRSGCNCCSVEHRHRCRPRVAPSGRRTGSSPTGGSPGGNGRCWRCGCCASTVGPRRTFAGCSPAPYAGSSAGSGR